MPPFLCRMLIPLIACLLGAGSGAVALANPAPPRRPKQALTVAAAGDLRGTMEELEEAFEAAHPDLDLRLSFGASGSLASQIRQGAPFDVFLSADLGFPEALHATGLGLEAPFPYATGALVLWVRRDLGLDPERLGLPLLENPKVKRIATANPVLAPYGRAGVAALRQARLLEALNPRLVYADNIAQAAQFLRTGAAEAGLVSLSQARHPELEALGFHGILPAGSHPPLRQGGLLLKGSSHPKEARAFRAFLLSPMAQAIFGRHGFGKP